ncbi:hypothetical protein [Pseudomonas sp. PSKL.D1]|uniref:hypothetical protein n=1 Tax=Pseudomonas sp. PSKL.D1 TaxID=3029060 RepID=UPI00238112A6|nr:hypothetical protein [Pseudomonas sp. PSKL.D1]WDY60392.1 hypothetical protein PVV54_12425 [Pseudomonas sp. PSKL.D1]
MSSVIEICNMALSNIGASRRIDDLDEDSQEAEQCSLFYVHARDFVLRSDCEWAFATAFAALAEVADNPDPVFPYAYAMPNDCMRIRRIVNPVLDASYFTRIHCYGNPPQIPEIKFRVVNGSSQRLITTMEPAATLEYTLKVESSEMFDPVFVSALSWYLASKIAAPLAKDTSVTANCYAQYQADVLRAGAAALNEGSGPEQHESIFISGRN